MRKLFQLGKNAVARHLGMSALILLQIICILAGSNVLLASYQQQYILEQPFSEWLSSDGYYVTGLDMKQGEAFGVEESDGAATLGESLHGEWKRIDFYSQTCLNVTEKGKSYSLRVIVYDNDFWDAYAPVVQHGSWQRSSKSGKKPWCVATSNVFDHTISLPGASGSLEVKGILGDLCYIPMQTNWERNGSVADNFYYIFSVEREEEIDLLMPRSQWEQLGLPDSSLTSSDMNIVIPTRPLTTEEKQYNAEIFTEFGSPEIAMSTLRERSQTELQSRLRRFLPLLIAQFVITVFGLICASAVQTLRDDRIFAVYGLCGMSRCKRMLINLSEYGMILFSGGAVTALIYLVTKLMGKHAEYGLQFTGVNILMSAGLLGALLLCSVLSPFLITRKKQLADILRRETT